MLQRVATTVTMFFKSFLQLSQDTNYDKNQSPFYIRYRNTTLMSDRYLPVGVASTA